MEEVWSDRYGGACLMEYFSYYYIIFWAGLTFFGVGISFGKIGLERKPTTAGSALITLILAIPFIIACFWMKKP